MPTEGFFQRWSRLKTEPEPAAEAPGAGLAGTAPAVPRWQAPAGALHGDAPASGGAAARMPTLDDVAQLDAGSDYSAFVARGVDQSVRRSALKKLFSDPHFNIGDGLDLYMGDYNRPDPIPAAMMSALRHTESFFAQAYPEKKNEEEGGADTDRLAGGAVPAQSAGTEGAQSSANPCEPISHADPQPPLANTTGAAGAIEANT